MKKIYSLFFTNISLLQIITKNTFWITVGKLLGGLLRAFLVILSAKILGPSLYGSFSLAMNFVLIFSFLPELGLTAIFTKELSKKETEEEKRKIFNEILSISLFISLISYILIIFLGSIFLKDKEALAILPILSLMMIFDVLREFTYAFYRGELRGELHGLFHFLTNLLLFLMGAFSLYLSKNITNLAYAYLLGIGLGFIIGCSYLKNYFKKFKFIFNLQTYLSYINLSWPIALANALYLLLLFVDSIILGWFFPSYMVGLYTSSVKINEFLIIFPTGISLALLPMFSKYLNNRNKLKESIEFGIELVYLILLPVTFLIFINAKDIVLFIFGSDYFYSFYGLKILIFSLIANSLFMIFSQFLIAIDKRRELIIYEIIAFTVNLVLNLILIPYFDFIGASYVTFLTNFLTMLLGYFVVQKYIQFDIFKGLKNPLLATIIMTTFLMFIKNVNLILITFLGGVIYFLTLLLLKEEKLISAFKKLISS